MTNSPESWNQYVPGQSGREAVPVTVTMTGTPARDGIRSYKIADAIKGLRPQDAPHPAQVRLLEDGEPVAAANVAVELRPDGDVVVSAEVAEPRAGKTYSLDFPVTVPAPSDPR